MRFSFLVSTSIYFHILSCFFCLFQMIILKEKNSFVCFLIFIFISLFPESPIVFDLTIQRE